MSLHRHKVIITDTADAEFADVLAYTEEEWGVEQRNSYRDLFVGAVERLSRTPLLGKSRDDLGPGLRSIPMGQHVIYYSLIDDVVYIRRILHRRRRPQGMDWESN